mgnify:FL=1|jgi:hypothetical protein
MKAITIKQPWASLIVHGIKDIENRSWQTNFRGRVLIHSSVKGDISKFGCLQPNQRLKVLNTPMSRIGFNDLPFGSIIGSVEIVDCVQNYASVWADKGAYNWVLANPVLFPEPIPAKGKLSFWEYDRIQQPQSDGDHKICMCRICVDEKVQVMSMGNYFVCKYCGGRWYK